MHHVGSPVLPAAHEPELPVGPAKLGLSEQQEYDIPHMSVQLHGILVVGQGSGGKVDLHLQARCSHPCHWCRCIPAQCCQLVRSWPVREQALSAA